MIIKDSKRQKLVFVYFVFRDLFVFCGRKICLGQELAKIVNAHLEELHKFLNH